MGNKVNKSINIIIALNGNGKRAGAYEAAKNGGVPKNIEDIGKSAISKIAGLGGAGGLASKVGLGSSALSAKAVASSFVAKGLTMGAFGGGLPGGALLGTALPVALVATPIILGAMRETVVGDVNRAAHQAAQLETVGKMYKEVGGKR